MPTAIDLFEKARRHERLEQLRAAREHDLMPYFRVVEAEPGPIALMESKERITLGSNNYLGLTGDARVKTAAREALEHYGTGLTGSRFMNGTTPLHLELERELAEWMGSEDAIVYTTGYLANTGAIGTLLDPGDTDVCDSGDHAPILVPVALYRHRWGASQRGLSPARAGAAPPAQPARQARDGARSLRVGRRGGAGGRRRPLLDG